MFLPLQTELQLILLFDFVELEVCLCCLSLHLPQLLLYLGLPSPQQIQLLVQLLPYLPALQLLHVEVLQFCLQVFVIVLAVSQIHTRIPDSFQLVPVPLVVELQPVLLAPEVLHLPSQPLPFTLQFAHLPVGALDVLHEVVLLYVLLLHYLRKHTLTLSNSLILASLSQPDFCACSDLRSSNSFRRECSSEVRAASGLLWVACISVSLFRSRVSCSLFWEVFSYLIACISFSSPLSCSSCPQLSRCCLSIFCSSMLQRSSLTASSSCSRRMTTLVEAFWVYSRLCLAFSRMAISSLFDFCSKSYSIVSFFRSSSADTCLLRSRATYSSSSLIFQSFLRSWASLTLRLPSAEPKVTVSSFSRDLRLSFSRLLSSRARPIASSPYLFLRFKIYTSDSEVLVSSSLALRSTTLFLSSISLCSSYYIFFIELASIISSCFFSRSAMCNCLASCL